MCFPWSTRNVWALRFPRLIRRPGCPGAVGRGDLEHNRVTRMLRNPRYAGAFFYGRTRRQKKIDGGWRKKPLSRQEWHTLIPDAHPGYITWQDYEENLRSLQENAGVGVIPPPAKTVSR